MQLLLRTGAAAASAAAVVVFVLIVSGMMLLPSSSTSAPASSSAGSVIKPLHDMAGYILTLDAQASRPLADAVVRHLTSAEPRLWGALNGTGALLQVEAKLPLYTRLALAAGRHDHMQIGTPEMLACLLGHMAIWHDIRARGLAQALVLEEDAFIDETSAARMVQFLGDTAHEPSSYDVLMLEHGHITVSGATRAIGVLARTWMNPSDALHNRWMGTRGYIVRASAVPRLLKHAETMDVQVDAVLNLAVVFDGLRMLWPALEIAQPSLLRLSMVRGRDPCIKCFVPADSGQVVLLLALFMALIGALALARPCVTSLLAWSAPASSSLPASPSPRSTCSVSC